MSGSRRVTLTVPRDTAFLSVIRRAVVVLAQGSGFPAGRTAEIEMAVDEAASNAIRHGGGGGVTFEAVSDGEGITVTIADGGAPFAFESQDADLDAWRESSGAGGLGVYIIKRFMDEVEYRHRPETGNELRMRKYLCPTSTS